MNQGATNSGFQTTVQRSLLRLVLRSRRLVHAPMLTAVHQQRRLEISHRYRNWASNERRQDDGIYQQDIADCHTTESVRAWFKEHQDQFIVLPYERNHHKTKEELQNKKHELFAKLQLAKLEKEIELHAKNKALSLNPAAKVEEKQFETNIENMIKSIKTLSLPVPTRSENFNLFFQSLERAFLTKKINDEYKSEILINLLGERVHNVLLYIKEAQFNDYEKLFALVLREFQLTPRECLNSFKNAVKSSGETYIQFAARLTANFQYYCSLRKVNSFESLCDLIISDKLFETLNKETATHIGIREAEDWFRPIDLAKECDIYISSRSGSHKEILLLEYQYLHLWIYPRPL
ncbi:DUF1758 domain-containing protein [Trichonephila clavipes]|nr:DUF1758 domain-containing protein [Trichonephila clavipes]